VCCEDVELGIVGKRGGIGEEKSGGRTGGSRDCDRVLGILNGSGSGGAKEVVQLNTDSRESKDGGR